MILRECATIVIIAIIGLVAGIGYASSFFLGDDNAVEEVCEKVIAIETGKDIDLTENSPESATEAKIQKKKNLTISGPTSTAEWDGPENAVIDHSLASGLIES